MTQQHPVPPISGIPEAPDALSVPPGDALVVGGGSPPHTTSSSGDTSSVKERAADTADAGKQAAGEVASTAADKAQDVVQETKQQARNVLHEARDQARTQAKDQHRNLVTNLRSLADEFGQMAQRSDVGGPGSDLVGQAGQRAGSVADWLDAREPGQLVEEVRRYARRSPGTFVLGALAAGVLAGRLTRGVVAAHSDDDTSGAEVTGRHEALSSTYPDQTAYERTGGVQPPGTVYGNAPSRPGSVDPTDGGSVGGRGYAGGGTVPDPSAFPEPTLYPGGTP